jgi:membrane protease YdiL (CAAX protease family)
MNATGRRLVVWSVFLVVALLALDVLSGAVYGVVVPVVALVLAYAMPGAVPRTAGRVDRTDLAVVAGLYGAVVVLFSLAFRVFTQDHVAGLFLCFGAGMLIGVVGPLVYTVWVRGRPLADLGLTRDNLLPALMLGLLLGGVQFGLTLWGYDLPAPVDWVPLLVLALTVGVFESIFFRGFIQTRLQASFGTVPGIGAAAALYGLYHVGYGMGADEMLFLFGLGVVYAIAYAAVRNLVVLWPLLTPLGSFYANLESGDIEMPWASILGFLDVLALMAAALWLTARHQQRGRQPAAVR